MEGKARLVMVVNQMRLRVVVLHGAHGGPDTNWFPWLHSVLEAQDLEVVRPGLPTPQGQSLTAWLDAYDSAVGVLPPAPTVLVGHSLGAAFALRLVERAQHPVTGLFLAAGLVGALGRRHCLGRPLLEACTHATRLQSTHLHTERSNFGCERIAEAADRPLCGVIRRVARYRDAPSNRRHLKDVPALLPAHHRHGCPRCVDHAEQAGFDHCDRASRYISTAIAEADFEK